MSDVVEIEVEGRYAYAYAPFGARDASRELPGRRWIPERKAWRIPSYRVDEAVEIYAEYGFRVMVLDDDETRGWSASPSASAPNLSDALRVLFRQVSADRRQILYRGLAKAFHPDIGGTTEQMQSVDAVYRSLS